MISPDEYLSNATTTTSVAQSLSVVISESSPPSSSSSIHHGRLRDFYKSFNQFHPYIAFSMCVFGVLANCCLVGVLSRPRMRSTVNRLLTSIASIDTALMLSYSVYLAHFRLADRDQCPVHLFTYAWTVFQLVHANFSVFARACTLWLSATVAGYSKHVVALSTPISSAQQTEKNVRVALRLTLGVTLAVLAASVPIFVQNSSIKEGRRAPVNDTTCPANHQPYYVLQAPEFASSNPYASTLLSKITFMMNGIILKFLPCLFLAYFLAFLVYALYAHERWRDEKFVDQRRRRSSPAANTNTTTATTISTPRGSVMSNHQSSAPTTLILTAILCTTLLCELPNAVLSLICSLSSMDTTDFVIKEVYVNLGDVLDLLSLVSCSSTSILYCVMSHLFRDTFLQLFFKNNRRLSIVTSLAAASPNRQRTNNNYQATNVSVNSAPPRSRSFSPSAILITTTSTPQPQHAVRPYARSITHVEDSRFLHLDNLQPLLGSSV